MIHEFDAQQWIVSLSKKFDSTLLQCTQLAKVSSTCNSKGTILVTLKPPKNCIKGACICGVLSCLHINSMSRLLPDFCGILSRLHINAMSRLLPHVYGILSSFPINSMGRLLPCVCEMLSHMHVNLISRLLSRVCEALSHLHMKSMSKLLPCISEILKHIHVNSVNRLFYGPSFHWDPRCHNWQESKFFKVDSKFYWLIKH